MPQKLLTDHAWVDAFTRVVEKGRKLHKEVVLHTHFNHPREITAITKRALDRLCERGITVRNQTVLQRRVNDSIATMQLLVKRLSYVNIHPYYVYMHDLVKGVEDLRTTLQTGLEIEKGIRGATAGFNTPTVVVDAPGGGGKRDVHSFEHYDRETGISVFTSPSVHSEATYFYFDPLHSLSPEVQKRWKSPIEQDAMLATAIMVEKHTRGSTAGFNTPTFVVDAPGGGGKRDAHSFEHYDRTTGISVYTAPSVKKDVFFCYFDPIDLLPEEGRRRWSDPSEHPKMIEEALALAALRAR